LAQADQAGERDNFGTPSTGLVATADRFIGNAALLDALREALLRLIAVEMEGAAVAQVAEQECIPWLILRVISDGADANAAQSFGDFIQRYDRRAWYLIQALLSRAKQAPQQ
jgi:adenosylhomocysteine nucleosidase